MAAIEQLTAVSLDGKEIVNSIRPIANVDKVVPCDVVVADNYRLLGHG